MSVETCSLRTGRGILEDGRDVQGEERSLVGWPREGRRNLSLGSEEQSMKSCVFLY